MSLLGQCPSLRFDMRALTPSWASPLAAVGGKKRPSRKPCGDFAPEAPSKGSPVEARWKGPSVSFYWIGVVRGPGVNRLESFWKEKKKTRKTRLNWLFNTMGSFDLSRLCADGRGVRSEEGFDVYYFLALGFTCRWDVQGRGSDSPFDTACARSDKI